MAKSARASITKKNHRNLRAKVFGPAHDARTARLSAKLQELAAKPRPEQEKAMDVDQSNDQDSGNNAKTSDSDEMELDGLGRKVQSTEPNSRRRKSGHKEHKITKRKAKNMVVFPSEMARRNKMAKRKTKR